MAGLMVMLILAGADKAATKYVFPQTAQFQYTTRSLTSTLLIDRVKAKRAAKRAAKQAEEQHQTREQYFHSNKAREAASERGRAREELEDEMGLESPPAYEGHDAPRYSVEGHGSATQRVEMGEGSAVRTGRNVLVRRRRSEEQRDHGASAQRLG